ncbi:PaaI family thioesterase [Streptomyces sp. CA-243310]|uniref:PaaI family thioesterase n=1 Tax=Streptomyces sp. CA-243310 TaxID=3240056 RepID=UPI003D8EE04C
MTMPAAQAVSADNAATRSRTHHWAAPTSGEYGGHRSGLEVLRLMLEGRIPQPSIGSTLGFRLVDATPGHVAFEGEPGEHLLNPMGAVHGGFLAALLDSALGGAVMAALPADRAYTEAPAAPSPDPTAGAGTPDRSSAASARSVGQEWRQLEERQALQDHRHGRRPG